MVPRPPRPRRRGRRPAALLLLAAASLAAPAARGFLPVPSAAGPGAPAARRAAAAAGALPAAAACAPALADAGGTDVVMSALVAYGHYASILLVLIFVVVERLLIKPSMTEEEQWNLIKADSMIGLGALGIVGTGYLRVAQYGKGWDFYQHEPVFWLKMTLVAITGAASFFVTTTVVKRAVALTEAAKARGADAAPAGPSPVSQQLVDRLSSILNAELLAYLAVPLTATLMARGVGYADWFPWQAGAGAAGLCLLGLGFRYVREALDLEWSEGEEAAGPAGSVGAGP